jgi:2-polyprenyl-3-methyl-5-hydroxy-6-metoxy-1,4-benzoquinol methylase
MKSSETDPPSPYQLQADTLRTALSDPTINSFEHTINWPRLQALLPPARKVRSILDFGCGPGGFTQELAGMYPKAYVLGADISEAILPKQPDATDGHVRFVQWDGMVPQNFEARQALLDRFGTFDLVVAKMTMHYVQDNFSRMQGLWHLINPGVHLLFSVPHPMASGARLSAPYEGRRNGAGYIAEIGNTGVRAAMVHRTTGEWIARLKQLNDIAGYRTIIDEPAQAGIKKRLNILLCPQNTDVSGIISRIAHLEGRPAPAFKDRMLGALGLSRITVTKDSRGKATSEGCTGWLIKEGQILAQQQEAEYSWLI